MKYSSQTPDEYEPEELISNNKSVSTYYFNYVVENHFLDIGKMIKVMVIAGGIAIIIIGNTVSQ